MFVVARAELHAPKQEIALLAHALNLLVPMSTDEGGFHAPSIMEFFPPAVLFEGTPFEINRVTLVQFIAVAAVLVVFWLGTRRMRVVPGRFQSLVEMGLDLVRVNVAVPLVLAIVAYVTFIYAGIKKSPGKFFKNSLFPAGVPWPVYIIVTPIELISTFIIRPITLTLRLLMNMVVGHLLLVLFFAATQFFFFTAGGWWALLGVGSLAFGLAFTLFEILVAVLQAYVFTLLTAVYIQLAVAEEH
jgi:F-type H+-transporting ATPase subunit a